MHQAALPTHLGVHEDRPDQRGQRRARERGDPPDPVVVPAVCNQRWAEAVDRTGVSTTLRGGGDRGQGGRAGR